MKKFELIKNDLYFPTRARQGAEGVGKPSPFAESLRDEADRQDRLNGITPPARRKGVSHLKAVK